MEITTQKKPRIVVVEDEAIIAEEIISTVSDLGYQVVAHVMNGDKALDIFAREQADLVLLDINIKGSKNGIELAHILKDNYDVPFVFLTSHSDHQILDEVKKTMPYGFILKPFNEHDLRTNIELALYKYHSEKQDSLFAKEVVEKKYNVKLSDREFSVLSMFKQGKSYKETADALYISVNTVKSYQKKLYSQFDVNSKAELLNKL